MHFSRSFIASALLGLAAATNHEVEAPAVPSEAPVAAHISTPVAAEHASSVAPVHAPPPMAEHVSSVAVVETPAAQAPPPMPEHVSPPPAAVHVSSVAPVAEHVSSVAPVAEHVSSVAPVAEHVSSAAPMPEHVSSVVVAEPPAAPPAVHTSAVVVSETPAAHVSPPAAHVSPPPAAHPSAAAGAHVNTHVVQVGGPNGTLVFSPDNIVAQPGDLVQFQFNPKNHSVVQSTFDQPCVPIQNIMPNKTDAFFSGFMPANASSIAAGNLLTYTIRVMDTKPIWYYCSQGMHCQAGMVGAINAPPSGNRTVSTFKNLAAAAPQNLSPGGQIGQGAPAPPAAPSNGAGVSQSVAVGGPTPSSPDQPAQQTTNAAGRISQSFIGLAVTMLAAFMVL